MSLLLDSENRYIPTLLALYQAAHAPGAQDAEALSFWQHLFSKHVFKEEYFICDAEMRPAPGDRRRIDRSVRYLSTGNEIIVLCWHEAKGGSTPSAIMECESQALDACKRAIISHPWQPMIYAFTTTKTSGKA
ncbi:hypothetical protein AYO20_04288 [Fonsecaea nubica]|uniref:Uncharacterized protein n=1 Tax=Fonsecaea nubica TaxID=856822 RepID=A0A178D4A9_9EURO|nr:hypothetical protein AYO20_04288 [Fonsecaea nubica]OAL36392.1 hypothetical protein AYO20_04288 [Fonsecaea nubica]